jgi:hypothetical protein
MRLQFLRLGWLPAILLVAGPASAHDWYPYECCHELDCAPVDAIDTSSGELVVTTKLGTVAVPASFARRESKDHRMHVCMRPGEAGAMRLLCVFLPPAS